MKTTLSTMKTFFEINGDKPQKFDDIFNYVEKEMSPQWAQLDKDLEETIENKKGEIYKLLTIEGSFKLNEDDSWSFEG